MAHDFPASMTPPRPSPGSGEVIARIIDPDAWLLYDNANALTKMERPVSLWRVETSLTKAAAILSLGAAQPPWQPIETAPKDGTEILGLCEWEPCTAVLFYQSGDWLVRWDHSKFSGGFEATHWIPIPPASSVSSTNHQSAED